MKTKADRQASAKRAWETMRANKAAGIAPASAGKAAAKVERDYSGLIGAWLKLDGAKLDAARMIVDALAETAVAIAEPVAAPVVVIPEPVAEPVAAPVVAAFTVIPPPTAPKVRKAKAKAAPVAKAAKRNLADLIPAKKSKTSKAKVA